MALSSTWSKERLPLPLQPSLQPREQLVPVPPLLQVPQELEQLEHQAPQGLLEPSQAQVEQAQELIHLLVSVEWAVWAVWVEWEVWVAWVALEVCQAWLLVVDLQV